MPSKKLKLKNISNIDINTINSFSPLLCLYRKASPKLINVNNTTAWNEESFKKEINIASNAFMTLSLLDLDKYYRNFDGDKPNKQLYGAIYNQLAKKQLEFYAAYCRNSEGIFVDKKDESSDVLTELRIEDKSTKFLFSDQALMMAAYYRYGSSSEETPNEEYMNFSKEILDMFLDYREDLYDLSLDELSKICLGFNLYVEFSRSEQAQQLLINLCELLNDSYSERCSVDGERDIELASMVLLNNMMLYKNTNILKFADEADVLTNRLISMYDSDLGVFLNHPTEKELTYSSKEILLYVLSLMCYANMTEDTRYQNAILDIYKRQFLGSNIVLSWPEIPTLEDPERYVGFSMRSEDLKEDSNFKMPTVASIENVELAPVFIKEVSFKRKKETFKPGGTSFDHKKHVQFLHGFASN